MSTFGSNRGGGRRGGRSWGGGGGGFDDARPSWWRRIIAQGDNPLMWSVPMGSLAGISIRVSLIYIVWMAIELTTVNDWTFKATYVASLFVLVLLHELGHCFACRAVGGEADNILLWMLGGFAYCRSPHNWRANFITTAGGPLVNVALVPVFMGVMMALGAPLASLVFNPWSPQAVTEAWLRATGGMGGPDWLKTPLFTLHITNLALLLFNVLLPMFPMDGGRLLQAILWRRMGYSRSMMVATTVGLFAAVVVGLFALSVQSWLLIALAIMCGITCYQQKQQLRFMAAQGGGDDEPWRASLGPSDGDAWRGGGEGVVGRMWGGGKRGGGGGGGGGGGPDAKRREKAAKAAAANRARAEADNAELDRILAKIKDKGMASLSSAEQSFLKRSTEKGKGR
ncbi:MAG: hypothetical protein Q8L55_01720 [Phycisphaerales bacterium]|nr:hypothetical protein [Phycisphaerales bacterium]